ISLGFRLGFLCSSRAAAPLATGAAIDVPLRRMCAPSGVTRSGYLTASSALDADSGATIFRPGATRSGLARASCVLPRPLNEQTLSSSSLSVWLSSRQPTVMTNGSLPGAYHVAPLTSPRLPAEATTVTPARH